MFLLWGRYAQQKGDVVDRVAPPRSHGRASVSLLGRIGVLRMSPLLAGECAARGRRPRARRLAAAVTTPAIGREVRSACSWASSPDDRRQGGPRCAGSPSSRDSPRRQPRCFFALGGTALAVSDAVRPQARCTTGAVRAIAGVTGDPARGIGNLPDRFTSNKGRLLAQVQLHRWRNPGATSLPGRVRGALRRQRRAGRLVAGGSTCGTVHLRTAVHRGPYRPGDQHPPFDAPFVLFAM